MFNIIQSLVYNQIYYNILYHINYHYNYGTNNSRTSLKYIHIIGMALDFWQPIESWVICEKKEEIWLKRTRISVT